MAMNRSTIRKAILKKNRKSRPSKVEIINRGVTSVNATSIRFLCLGYFVQLMSRYDQI